jgi:predicted O-methyltransferase YrrM
VSERTRPIDERHLAYVAERAEGDDAFLVELKRAARAAGLPAISIAPEQAALMQVLLRVARAREVVEVGTLAGYSAIRLARALPSAGRVRTIEAAPAHAAFARAWIARSDVAARVELHEGTGAEVLPRFADGSTDAVFLDADKASYGLYLEHALRLLRPGGLLMADNAFAFGELFAEATRDAEVPAIRAFNELVARERRLAAAIVPIGDGLWVAAKR